VQQWAAGQAKGELRMSAIPITAALSALAASATTIASAWFQAQERRLQAQDWSRRQVVRDLPPGSRVADLGRHGVIIELGSRPSGKHGG